jgi:hypothetical protein
MTYCLQLHIIHAFQHMLVTSGILCRAKWRFQACVIGAWSSPFFVGICCITNMSQFASSSGSSLRPNASFLFRMRLNQLSSMVGLPASLAAFSWYWLEFAYLYGNLATERLPSSHRASTQIYRRLLRFSGAYKLPRLWIMCQLLDRRHVVLLGHLFAFLVVAILGIRDTIRRIFDWHW